MRTTTVVDATETEHRPGPLPSVVDALQERGFVVIGRLATLSTVAGRDDRLYDRTERHRLATWHARPAATLVVAGDGSAFATVDTFGDAAVLRLRTALADGSLVETVGVAPEGALLPRTRVDALGGFVLGEARGRSVRLVRTAAVVEVLERHAQHVAEVGGDRGSEPVAHRDRDQAVRLWRRAARHDTACSAWRSRRSRRLFLGVWLGTVAVVLLAWLALLVRWRVESPAAGVALVLALVVAVSPLVLLAARRGQRGIDAGVGSRPAYPVADA
ncbi:hypothetical protein [Nocardioides okcheonensis]|uniref:hypothetical protein n=1 Tax=Nocardioides okcheonensis TaxID=2894081 RepID=UPI001E5A5B75|nr:hypothetical protein [Nocardioides okcheonensis]UFN43626.1 hypothetical protein LN652_16500 [Nocardioides okcheonensis]